MRITLIAFHQQLRKLMGMMSREPSDRVGRGYVSHLLYDVIASERRLAMDDHQSHRRDLIRTQFAAIEGSVWLMRENVHATSKDIGYLTSLADLALRERSFVIEPNGHVKEQVKFTPLPAAIHLIVKQAMLVAPELRVDFGHSGWASLRRAIDRRNRVTHPKSMADLEIGDGDLADARSATSWIMATTEYVLAGMNNSLAAFIREMVRLLDQLGSGDPDALAAYNALLLGDADD